MSLNRVPSPFLSPNLPIHNPPTLVYSVVIPLYNDAAGLTTLHERVSAVMADLGQPYEIVYV
ncbi:MAG: hypothetical protein D6796_15390, partial [Caldilineae bacterium]